MPEWVTFPERVRRGKRMSEGKGWRLLSPAKYGFKARLVYVLESKKVRLAIFRLYERS